MGHEKEELIERLSEQGYLKTEKVKEAILKIPREEFVPPENKVHAYMDQPLPIGHGQTISAPHMVVILCEKLELKEGMKVFEVGTGLGYNAAVVAEIVGPDGHVYTVERLKSLATCARENLERTGYSDVVTVMVGDGTMGYPEKAPYDRIYATASAPKVPEPLKEQLKIGGKLVMPVGANYQLQELVCMKRVVEDEFKTQRLGGVVFVPMIGKHAWPED